TTSNAPPTPNWEGFIDAYVNAPMPGAFRGHDPGGSYGPCATSPDRDFDNSNPIPTNRALAASSHDTASGSKPGSSIELWSTGSAPESSYTRP
ncbi:MAG TPA: hypothetical protein VN428_25190, partial [Bryobacteraceae bacterium]|nr:hypothetical protein [Bryobacteraceae bacterium]